MYENAFTHRRKVLYIYAKERSSKNNPIRYGDEVALFYRENDQGFGLWLSCESDRKQCSLGTCPGLPHLKHWMWNTESCPENKFIVTGSYISDYHDSLGRSRPLKVGDQVHFIRNSRLFERHAIRKLQRLLRIRFGRHTDVDRRSFSK